MIPVILEEGLAMKVTSVNLNQNTCSNNSNYRNKSQTAFGMEFKPPSALTKIIKLCGGEKYLGKSLVSTVTKLANQNDGFSCVPEIMENKIYHTYSLMASISHQDYQKPLILHFNKLIDFLTTIPNIDKPSLRKRIKGLNQS